MPAAAQDFDIEQGTTWRYSFTYGSPLVDANGELILDSNGKPQLDQPFDLTDCTARMQIREKLNSEVLVELTTENNGITLGGALGTVTLLLTEAESNKLGFIPASNKTITKAVYDLELIWPNSDVVRLLAGNITIVPNVTRVEPAQP